MKRLALALAVVAVLTGCSGASNSGGRTTCADFLAMRTEDQDATVARYLKERDGKNSSTGDIVSQRSSFAKLCTPEDKKDTKIADLG